MRTFTSLQMILIFTSGIIFLNSCTDDSGDKFKCSFSGNVIGEIHERCGCCPGWLVQTGSDTLKFLTVPEDDLLRDLVNFYGFPLPVRFSYTDDTTSCSDHYKIMACIDFELDQTCPKTGEIIGYDYTECLCCPGWIIKVGDDTIKVPLLPVESQVRSVVENSGFPVSVQLDYVDETGFCNDFYKRITCFKLN